MDNNDPCVYHQAGAVDMKRRVKKQSGPDDAKLRELVLYLAASCECDAPFGSVKLNKLLFNADFLAYRYLGKSITGQDYQALEHGPAPRRLLLIIRRMQGAKELVIRKRGFHGHEQNRPIALRSAKLHLFNAEEIALVDELIRVFWGKTARQVSEQSHDFIGWQLAQPGETIPYAVSLVDFREPTTLERKRGAALESIAKRCLEQSD